jgi:hypothetical protein
MPSEYPPEDRRRHAGAYAGSAHCPRRAPETGYRQRGIVILRVDDDGRIAERWSAWISM